MTSQTDIVGVDFGAHEATVLALSKYPYTGVVVITMKVPEEKCLEKIPFKVQFHYNLIHWGVTFRGKLFQWVAYDDLHFWEHQCKRPDFLRNTSEPGVVLQLNIKEGFVEVLEVPSA